MSQVNCTYSNPQEITAGSSTSVAFDTITCDLTDPTLIFALGSGIVIALLAAIFYAKVWK